MHQAKRKPLRFLRYLGLILLIALVIFANPNKLFSVAHQSNPLWLILAFLLNIPQLGIKAFRWNLIVRWQDLNLTYPRAFLAYFTGLLIGFLTPGRIGEMVKAVTLKYETDTSLSHALSSVLMDRIFDLYLLLTLGILGFLHFALVGDIIELTTFLIMCFLFIIPLWFLHKRSARWIGNRIVSIPFFKNHRRSLHTRINQFANGLSFLTSGRILILTGLTISSYFIFFIQCLFCAWALNFSIRFVDLILLMAATNLASLLPITISGLGTREACLTFFLSQVHPPQLISTAVMYGLSLFLVLFIGGGLIGFVCWQCAPIGLQQALKDYKNKE